jgi:hypothetical protein
MVEGLTCRLKSLRLQAWPQSLAAVEALTSETGLLGRTVAVGCCSSVLSVWKACSEAAIWEEELTVTLDGWLSLVQSSRRIHAVKLSMPYS